MTFTLPIPILAVVVGQFRARRYESNVLRVSYDQYCQHNKDSQMDDNNFHNNNIDFHILNIGVHNENASPGHHVNVAGVGSNAHTERPDIPSTDYPSAGGANGGATGSMTVGTDEEMMNRNDFISNILYDQDPTSDRNDEDDIIIQSVKKKSLGTFSFRDATSAADSVATRTENDIDRLGSREDTSQHRFISNILDDQNPTSDWEHDDDIADHTVEQGPAMAGDGIDKEVPGKVEEYKYLVSHCQNDEVEELEPGDSGHKDREKKDYTLSILHAKSDAVSLSSVREKTETIGADDVSLSLVWNTNSETGEVCSDWSVPHGQGHPSSTNVGMVLDVHRAYVVVLVARPARLPQMNENWHANSLLDIFRPKTDVSHGVGLVARQKQH